MYKLEKTYGIDSFNEWSSKRSKDLSASQTAPGEAYKKAWTVRTYRELAENVAFLGSMNKRLTLFFRGQGRDLDPVPTLFRQKWKCFDGPQEFLIDGAARRRFWNELDRVGQWVYEICETVGMPRRRGLRDTREVQWAVIQHYGLWPTPLIDITNSLRVAASFALDCKQSNSATGFVYVVGMPHTTGSLSYDIDQQLVLARLQSACPPIAKRPHYQDGFLVGRFPMYEATERLVKKSSLKRRMVAKFELRDSGNFWDEDFPVIQSPALVPPNDPLAARFLEELGRDARRSVHTLAKSIC